MSTLSDQELVLAYRKGDERMLALLVQRYLAPLYRFFLRMVGDGATAEDLTQETFLKAWKHLGRYAPEKSFKTWLFSIARNTAIDHLRKKTSIAFSDLENEETPSFAEDIPDDGALPDELYARAELGKVLDEEVQKLPPKSRAIVILHEAEELTFQEIAEAQGEPMNTVKSRYRRAMEALRKSVGERLKPDG